MKAVVKDVRVGTVFDLIVFIDEMRRFVGRTIDVEPKSVNISTGWYMGRSKNDCDNGYLWHRSWLEFVDDRAQIFDLE